MYKPVKELTHAFSAFIKTAIDPKTNKMTSVRLYVFQMKVIMSALITAVSLRVLKAQKDAKIII